MNLFNIQAFYQYLVRGLILLLAVLLDNLRSPGVARRGKPWLTLRPGTNSMPVLIETHTLLAAVVDVQPDGGKVLDLIVRTIGGWVFGRPLRTRRNSSSRGGSGRLVRRQPDLGARSHQVPVGEGTGRNASARRRERARARRLANARSRRVVVASGPVARYGTRGQLDRSAQNHRAGGRRSCGATGNGGRPRRMEAAYLGMERSIPLDLDACCDADLAFHRSIIAASHNIVLKSLIGTIETTLKASFLLTTSLMDNQSRMLAVHKDVMDCIRFRDVAGARFTMNRLLDLAQQDYWAKSKRRLWGSDTVSQQCHLAIAPFVSNSMRSRRLSALGTARTAASH